MTAVRHSRRRADQRSGSATYHHGLRRSVLLRRLLLTGHRVHEVLLLLAHLLTTHLHSGRLLALRLLSLHHVALPDPLDVKDGQLN